jgi:hypothetical protein
MSTDIPALPPPDGDRAAELEKALTKRYGSRVARFLMNGVAGLLPGVGGFVGAGAAAWSEAEQDHINDVLKAWLKLHEDEIREIGITMAEVLVRLNLLDADVKARVESREFLSLVRKALRDWAAAESEEKRVLIRNLLANAASCRLCSDDIVKLFVEWIRQYSEAHFKVIRTIYQNPESTRAEIWSIIHGEHVREDSAEADLFKLLIRDLSMGAVIRQARETDGAGNFVRQRPRRKGRLPTALTSAFDDDKDYVLTELGKQFVHYTMNEIVPRLGAATAAPAWDTAEPKPASTARVAS